MNKAEIMARDEKRISASHPMCVHMNSQQPKVMSKLFYSEGIGYARVFWNGKQWMIEWYDNVVRFDNSTAEVLEN